MKTTRRNAIEAAIKTLIVTIVLVGFGFILGWIACANNRPPSPEIATQSDETSTHAPEYPQAKNAPDPAAFAWNGYMQSLAEWPYTQDETGGIIHGKHYERQCCLH